MNIFYLPTPSGGDKCNDKYEDKFMMTAPLSGSTWVHYCTKGEGHGGRHKDDVSGREW